MPTLMYCPRSSLRNSPVLQLLPMSISTTRILGFYLRGLNRKFAQEHNLPTAYNRLTLMAVSVFHLSHWRLDVTVCNYILAV